MNDRFKFRAWDKETKSFLIHNEEDKTFDFNVFNSVLKKPEKYDILQCTGFKDENGKLIFEGDIIQFPNPLEENSFMRQVIKWEEHLIYIGYVLNLEHANIVEVIGNIYENKEMLDGNRD